MSRQRALVTGASGGIGLDIARELAARGFDLILTARSRDALERNAADLSSNAGVDVRVYVRDLTMADAARGLFEEISADNLAVDLLINNAGYAMFGPFADADVRMELEMLQINVIALTQLTRLFLMGMLQRRSGRILNVASTAAFQPGPFMALYYASKAYVLNFSEAIAEELRGTGVTVTVLCPGATQSGFQKRAGIVDARMFSGHVMDSTVVARAGVDALLRGQALVIPGFKNVAMAFGVRFLPRAFVTRFVTWLHGRVSPLP